VHDYYTYPLYAGHTDLVLTASSREELLVIQQTRQRYRTTAQICQLEILPESISILEGEIDIIIAKLGLENFCDLPGAPGMFSLLNNCYL
jgi:hypothetical protein